MIEGAMPVSQTRSMYNRLLDIFQPPGHGGVQIPPLREPRRYGRR